MAMKDLHGTVCPNQGSELLLPSSSSSRLRLPNRETLLLLSLRRPHSHTH